MALLLLTGMRDAAAVSLKIKHISIERGYVFQDPREVNTKFSKTIETFFFPVGYDVVAIVNDWVNLLTSEKLFSPNDPLFPKTLVEPGEQRSFEARGLSRKHWADASPVRAIFKAAFARIGLPYFQTPYRARHADPACVQAPTQYRSVEGVEPEHGALERADHASRLRACLRRAAGRDPRRAAPVWTASPRIRECERDRRKAGKDAQQADSMNRPGGRLAGGAPMALS